MGSAFVVSVYGDLMYPPIADEELSVRQLRRRHTTRCRISVPANDKVLLAGNKVPQAHAYVGDPMVAAASQCISRGKGIKNREVPGITGSFVLEHA